MSLHTVVHRQLSELLAATQPGQEPAWLNNALRLLAKYRSTLLQNTLVHREGATIRGGPIRGMQFVAQSAEGCHLPKLIGCYEADLQPQIEAAIGRGYDTIVNVGCAEGYYAVGLGLRLPGARIFARDINPAAQEACRRVAALNGIASSVTVDGRLDPSELPGLAMGRTLLLCDIEGVEVELLDPDRCPCLRERDIIVELHDVVRADISRVVPARFADSHTVTIVRQGIGAFDLPAMFSDLGHLDQLLAVWDWRSGPTPWGVFLAR